MMMVYHPVWKDKSGRRPKKSIKAFSHCSLPTLLLVDQKALMETSVGALWHHPWPSADATTRSSPFPIFSVDDGW